MKNGSFPLRLGYAWDGIRAAYRLEHSFRVQTWAAGAVVLLLVALRPGLLWWALVGVMIVLVLAAELINTTLEHLIDHLHPERHPRIKIVKDCAAGAVLLLSLGAVWVAVLMILSELGFT